MLKSGQTNFSKFSLSTLMLINSLAPCFAIASDIPKGIPEDFKELWDRRTELVEVKFYGKNLGVHSIDVTPNDIIFNQPDEILTALKVNRESFSLLNSLIKKPLKRNSNLSCQNSYQDVVNCDFLTTKTLAVIYNESTGVVNVFVDPTMLNDEKTNALFNPTENVKKAFIQSQTINFSNSDGLQNLYFRGMSSAGISQNSYAIFDWDINYFNSNYHQGSNKSFNSNLNNFFYRTDFNKKIYLQFGLMDSLDLSRKNGGNFGFGLLPIPKIKGARFGSTQSYKNHNDNEISTPISIMLNQYSRIEAYKNNNLLGTFYHDAGVQYLDTSSFPVGSYTVELKYFINDKYSRSQRIHFNKSNSTIGTKSVDFFLQGGSIDDKPKKNQDKNVVEKTIQAGIRFPLMNNLSVQQGLSLLDKSKYIENKVDFNTGFLSGNLSVTLSDLYGSGESRGNSQNISYSDGVSISYYRYKQKQDDCKQNFDIGWTGCTENNNISLSYSIDNWLTNVGYSKNKNEYTYGRKNLENVNNGNYFYWKGTTKSWQLNTGRAFVWDKIILTTNFGLYQSINKIIGKDKGGFINFTISETSTKQDGNDQYLAAGYNYRKTKSSNSEQFFTEGSWRNNASSGYSETEMRFSGSSESQEAIVRKRNNTRFGDINATFSASSQNTTSNINKSASVSYDSSFAISKNGFYWGGNATGIDRLAAGVITVDANETKEPLIQVSSGQSFIQKLTGGDKLLIPVNGTTNENIEINEYSKSQVNVQIKSPNDKSLFILPGHLYEYVVSARASWTYIGRGLDEHGDALTNATILNRDSSKLDEEGGFSFDDSNDYSALYLLKNKDIFHCTTQNKKTLGAIIYLGDLHCKMITFEKLPLTLKNNNKLHHLLAQG